MQSSSKERKPHQTSNDPDQCSKADHADDVKDIDIQDDDDDGDQCYNNDADYHDWESDIILLLEVHVTLCVPTFTWEAFRADFDFRLCAFCTKNAHTSDG